jgi:hypothetical protein
MVIIIVMIAILLHWLAAAMLPVSWLFVLNGVITLGAVLLVYRMRSAKSSVASVVSSVQGSRPDNAVDGLLVKTHGQFSMHFSGANDDLAQVEQLLKDAIEKLMGSFNGMHDLIEEQRDVGNPRHTGLG